MKPKPTSSKKAYWEMNLVELREATKEFDKEWTGPGLPGKPLRASDKELHRKAELHTRRVKMGRPRIGLGSERIQIALERGLRVKIDTYAKKHGISRSRLVADALRAYTSHAA